MRSVPGMTSLEPTDNTALKQMLYLAVNTYGMFYIRMPRFAVEKIYGEESVFSLGQSAVLREGGDVTILPAGLEVPEALNVAELLAQNTPVPVGFIGSQEQFGEVGPLDYLQERYEMTAAHIAAKAKAVLDMK